MNEYQLTQTGEQVQDILNQAPTTEENLQSEITRSTEKDQELEGAIANEKQRAEGVESELQTAIGNEKSRAEGVEANLQDAIGAEKTRAEGIEGGLRTDVNGIESKIPTGASSENKLATEGFVNSSIATNTAEFKGTFPSLEALQTEVQDANQNDYAFVVTTDQDGNTTYSRYKYVEGTGWVFEYDLNNSSFTSAQWAAINSAITAVLVAKLAALPTAAALTQQLNDIIASVATEKTRAEGIESGLRTDVNANAAAIIAEKNRAEGVEGTLTTGLNGEILARQNADTALQQNINAEATLRGNADTALQTGIDGINAKIPTQASASNQLADKAFVNSSIATNTAVFKGTYNSLADLEASVHDANANDYAFVISTDADGNTVYNRYKYVDGTGWVFEYALNNSSFTASQWAAIQSGITAALVAKLNGLPDIDALGAMFTEITSKIPAGASSANKLVDYAQMVAALATKQNTLTFDNVPTENSNNPVKSGGVYSAIATVTAAVVGLQSSKQDKLTFDQYPTAGSENPVKSTGIYTAIENAAQNVENSLSVRISTNAEDIAQLQAAYEALTQNEVVVVAPTDTWPVANPQQNIIYRVVDRTNTPPQYYSDYMWNGSAMVQMAQYNNAIDDVPTAGSDNLVKSGGIVKFYGKFIDDPIWMYIITDKDGRILFGVHKDGSIEWAKGIPTPIKIYIEPLLSLKVDKQLGKSLINQDFADNQSVIENPEYFEIIIDMDGRMLEAIQKNGKRIFYAGVNVQGVDCAVEKDPVWLDVTLDKDGRILEGIKYDGTKYIYKIDNEEYRERFKRIDNGSVNLITSFDNLVCIGDSLTVSSVPVNIDGPQSSWVYRNAYVPYPKVLSRLSGNIDYQIIAVGGYSAKELWDEHGGDVVAKPNAIAFVYLGTNDGLTDTLATDVVGDNPDNWADNNIGCYCRFVNKLQTLGYKVVLIKCWTSTGNLVVTNNAIEHVATRFSCIACSTPNTQDMAYHKAAIAGYDLVHYNDLGYAWFAGRLVETVGNLSNEQKQLLVRE